MAKIQIGKDTGEIIPQNVMVETQKAPAIFIDINEVKVFHNNPQGLIDKINNQAGYIVFDVSTAKGRDECRKHASSIIRCIAPALEASKALATEAKKVVQQDVNFRREFENGVRAIAAYHRKPLTEFEEEQERIKEELRLEEEKRIADEKYLKDWSEAIDYDELFTLRCEKAKIERKAEEQRKVEEERERIEKEVADRMEKERERIRLEEEAKAQREIEAKLSAEQAEKDRIEREARQAVEEKERKRVAYETKNQLEEKVSQYYSTNQVKIINSNLDTDDKDFKEVSDKSDDYIPVKPNYSNIIKIAVSAIAKSEFITTEEARLLLFESVKYELGIK
jgi:colicin import membrane protein